MEAKHTPGPWKAIDDTETVAGPESGFCPYAGCGCCGSPYLRADAEEQQLADARLIAAAPELLTALKAAEGVLADELEARVAVGIAEYEAEVRGPLDLVRAAIAKAEGVA